MTQRGYLPSFLFLTFFKADCAEKKSTAHLMNVGANTAMDMQWTGIGVSDVIEVCQHRGSKSTQQIPWTSPPCCVSDITHHARTKT